jgi:hypothetical protein
MSKKLTPEEKAEERQIREEIARAKMYMDHFAMSPGPEYAEASDYY